MRYKMKTTNRSTAKAGNMASLLAIMLLELTGTARRSESAVTAYPFRLAAKSSAKCVEMKRFTNGRSLSTG